MQRCWVFHTQQFLRCIKNGPPSKGHPAWQLWEALVSTWASIPVECFPHLVQSMPCRIEAVLGAKGLELNIRMVLLMFCTLSVTHHPEDRKVLKPAPLKYHWTEPDSRFTSWHWLRVWQLFYWRSWSPSFWAVLVPAPVLGVLMILFVRYPSSPHWCWGCRLVSAPHWTSWPWQTDTKQHSFIFHYVFYAK